MPTRAEILALALAPRRVQGDEGSVEQHSAKDLKALLKLADELDLTEAQRTARRTIHVGQFRPGGGA